MLNSPVLNLVSSENLWKPLDPVSFTDVSEEAQNRRVGWKLNRVVIEEEEKKRAVRRAI